MPVTCGRWESPLETYTITMAAHLVTMGTYAITMGTHSVNQQLTQLGCVVEHDMTSSTLHPVTSSCCPGNTLIAAVSTSNSYRGYHSNSFCLTTSIGHTKPEDRLWPLLLWIDRAGSLLLAHLLPPPPTCDVNSCNMKGPLSVIVCMLSPQAWPVSILFSLRHPHLCCYHLRGLRSRRPSSRPESVP